MRVNGFKKKLHEKWISLSIRRKIEVFTGVVFLIILLSVMFDIWVVKFSLKDFRIILEENVKSSDFMDAIEAESRWFKAYIINPNEENQKEMEYACDQTKRAVLLLPGDYTSMSNRRYAKTWSIRNSYENYKQQRDYVLGMSQESQGYIQELYKVYDMQEYLQNYARILMRYTLDDGNAVYVNKVQSIRKVPLAVLVIGILLFGVMISLAQVMNKTLIVPIMKLVNVSKKIAANDFFTEDVKVENQDEMGELVKAFNKMKYATGEYIATLEERRKMLDLLHKEELEKIEVEKHLETANLELLKSQINPHFLFNTLNVIGGMAKLEDADTTEKMIIALSNIFRYNLKTPQNEVVLSQELRIAKDYMYLQQMRFGSRIRYSIECKVDMDSVMVPTFLFQPLIENAIIHGLSKKEEGGKVCIRILMKSQNIVITVADTGIGMAEQELKQLKEAFEQGITERIGIGLGNMYKRVHGMYRNGEVEIFSKENTGTVVRIIIPQKKWEE
jgi:two-component system LytT family sensor kinase